MVVLNLLFAPVIWGERTLLASVEDASSIVSDGVVSHRPAGSSGASARLRLPRSNDLGAPAWFSEPSYALIHNQIFNDRVAPLWNPYNGYGAPLLANMQSQPFNPLVWMTFICPAAHVIDLYLILRLFVAGFLMYAYLRLLIAPAPALFGSLAYMLSGYFIIYLNMPELTVSAWLPLLLIGTELIVRRVTTLAVALTALGSALVLYGGMPEVCFLELLFVAVYAKVRAFTTQKGYINYLKVISAFTCATISGALLAAPQILPFIEYIKESFNAHEARHRLGLPGLFHHTNLAAHFLTYIAPLAYGPLNARWLRPDVTFSGFHGYWGGVSMALGSIAAASAMVRIPFAWRRTFDRKRAIDSDEEFRPACLPVSLLLFYFLMVLFFIAKRFGHPAVNWLGGMPLFQLVLFWKYGEPLMAFSVAALAAFGLQELLSAAVSRRLLVGSGVVALSLGGALMIHNLPMIVAWKHAQHQYLEIVGAALALGAVVFVIAFAILAKPSVAVKHSCAAVLVLLVTAELSFNFLVPEFYKIAPLPARTITPYGGAPFIEFLRARNQDRSRLLGFDGVLFPNWSSVFSLFDVRNLDALYPDRYFS
ncbi:MAG TPA: hypothetical protein V6C72_17775, partial [Chroococcales cyanobacterium]